MRQVNCAAQGCMQYLSDKRAVQDSGSSELAGHKESEKSKKPFIFQERLRSCLQPHMAARKWRMQQCTSNPSGLRQAGLTVAVVAHSSYGTNITPMLLARHYKL